MRKLLTLLAATTAIAGCSTTPEETAGVPAAPRTAAMESLDSVVPEGALRPSPQIGSFGFDVAGMDRNVAPGQNFYQFASGEWLRTNEIPADRSNYGMFTMLDDLSSTRTRAIIEGAPAGTRMGDFYASFMDEAAIERAGLTPLQPLLNEVKAVRDRAQFASLLGRLMRQGVDTPFGAVIGSDDRLPDEMRIRLRQSGLGLPDRDFYTGTEANFVSARAAYLTYLTQLLTDTGEANPAARARAVMDFETGLARTHWTGVQNRNDEALYNKWTQAELARNARGFAWTPFLTEAGLAGERQLLVSQPSAFTGSAELISRTPVPVLRDYALLRTIDAYAPLLSSNFANNHFAFHGTALNGTPQNEPRWKRGVGIVTGSIADDVSQVYVQRHFPPETKAAADQLVRNVIAAMDTRLANLAWMAPETRQAARAKLAAFTPKIGYPDTWLDYSSVQISRDNLVRNVQNARAFDYQRNLAKLGRPVDRSEWGMTPMMVNAYANPVWNEIVFPAAILQPPFFDPNADPAINYGGIAAVIGHEISHHFDDQGSRYDVTGALREWWTPQDRERFTALTRQVVDQYSEYEVLPGRRLNGELTQGENIADLAGLTVAYDAYRLALNGQEAPVIDGFTGDQRFFLGWAQVWRREYREANLLGRLTTDVHSPSEYRTFVVRNLDPWYSAFQVQPGQPMYLAPEQRARIW